MTNDEILIKYHDALNGNFNYGRLNIVGWFYVDHEKKQPENERIGGYAGTRVGNRQPVHFDYKLFFEFNLCYLQLGNKKYRIKLLERTKDKAEMILINAQGKEEVWNWKNN